MTPAERLKDLDEGFPQRKQMPRAGFTITGEQLDWLIARVKELETENFQLRIDLSSSWHIDRVKPLLARVKRLTVALDFYSKKENYVWNYQDKANHIYDDSGKIASKALEQE